MVITTFHYVLFDEPGRRNAKALCGKRVDRYREHDINPNCPTCARLIAELEATLASAFGSTASDEKEARS